MIGAQRLLVGRQYCSLRLGTASAPWTTCSRGPRWTLLGSHAPATPLNVKPFGRIESDGYLIEKLVYETELGIIVPAVLFVPRTSESRKPAVVYVNNKGKSAGASDGTIDQLAKRRFVVLAMDMRGCGETRPRQNPDESDETCRYFGQYGSAMRAFLVGKTLVGPRARDISRGVACWARVRRSTRRESAVSGGGGRSDIAPRSRGRRTH